MVSTMTSPTASTANLVHTLTRALQDHMFTRIGDIGPQPSISAEVLAALTAITVALLASMPDPDTAYNEYTTCLDAELTRWLDGSTRKNENHQ